MIENNALALFAIVIFALLIGWCFFFYTVSKRQENVSDVLKTTHFLQSLVVIAVVSAVTILLVIGKIEANVVTAIFSSVIGYAFGSYPNKLQRSIVDEKTS